MLKCYLLERNIRMRRYYPCKEEAELHREKGEKILYEPGIGYYIARPFPRKPWEKIRYFKK